MYKIILAILFVSTVYGNSFDINCLKCHKDKKELKLFMARYTLKYSSPNSIKEALFKFLKHPTSNISIMPYSYIVKYGYKNDTTLDDKQLKQAIDKYYKLYNLKQYIK